MKDRLSIPVAIATGIVPGLSARRAPAPVLTIVADPLLTAVQNQAYSFVAQVQNAVGEAELTIIDAAPGLSVTPMGDNYFLVAGPITAFGSFEMVLRAEDGLERTAFLGPFTVAARRQTPQEAWGSKLKGLIDFAEAATLTIASGRVSAVVDPIQNLTFSQAFSTARPLYDERGFAKYDGNDDENTASNNPYGGGSTPREFIAVVRQDRLISNTTFYNFFSVGFSNNSGRRLSRSVPVASSRFGVSQGEGGGTQAAIEDTVDFSGVHIVRGIFGATQIRAQIDAAISAATNVSPNTGETRSRLGANANATAGSFGEISIAAVAIADSLTTDEWNAGQPWLNAAKARFTA